MTRTLGTFGIFAALSVCCLYTKDARADEATVGVVVPDDQVDNQPSQRPPGWQRRVDVDRAEDRFIAQDPELYRSPFRVAVGPTGITTGHGFGYGVGLSTDIGTGVVGGRFSAAWLHGEGKNDNGTSTPTGDSVGLYTGEITLDFHKKGPLHPYLGIGAGLLHASRTDSRSGFAGVGLSRFGLEYAFNFSGDADVRVGADLTGGLIGPADDEIKPLHAYVQTGIHIAIGF